MIHGPRLEPNHALEEYLNEYCLYQDGDEDVLCVECGQCKEVIAEEQKTISTIEDYMNTNCQKCSFGKGSPQCENCYVGGY